MTIRYSKICLVFSVAFFYTLVVLNNLTDFSSNDLFVHHVLLMDTTFAGNHGMWRALDSHGLELVFYCSIIGWELATAVLCWWGAVRLSRARRLPATGFHLAKGIAIAGLTASLLMWFVAFLSVGGEWFLMWQSKLWNGQEAAFRMFTVVGIILVYLALPEQDPQP